MAQRPFNPNQVGWSVKSWCADTDLSVAYVRELIATRKVDSVKIGGKRLITTPPAKFIESLRDDAA
jgi:hypothetical protein